MKPLRRKWNYLRSLLHAGRARYHQFWARHHAVKVKLLEKEFRRQLTERELAFLKSELKHQRTREREMRSAAEENEMTQFMIQAGLSKKDIERALFMHRTLAKHAEKKK